MKTITIAGASLALILSLSACSGTGGTITTSPAAPNAQPAETTTAPVETTPEPTPTEERPAKFGETFTFKDGISIMVAKPVPGHASETAAGAEETAGAIRVFTITITNNTKKVFDPSMISAEVNYGPDGLVASQVFDSAQNIGGGFEGNILPGKRQVGKMAFAIPGGPQDLLMSISPSFSHEQALFVGKL